MTRSLCVVGAGAAGAAATYALRGSPVDVTVLEKSRGVCGRAATRRRDGRRYDHGASHLPVADERVGRLVDALGTDGLVEIDAPVWTVDESGTVDETDGEPTRRVTWERGMTQLAKRALGATEATVERETRAAALDRDERGWRLTAENGESYGPFDSLLLTPPAPQTASLLAATGWSSERAIRLREAVGSVEYDGAWTVVLGYDRPLDREWFGLRAATDDQPLRWVGRESVKDGRVPDGEEILVVQMGSAWTREHEGEAVADAVAARVAALLDEPWLAAPAWTDDQRWRYARPASPPPAAALDAGEPDGLYLAGDWVAGEGRVDAALRSGLDVATRLE
ncbi:MAG: NAD(P)/FAD-dependent oxidoreductase [Haloferacaceae archaeon]